MGQQTPSVGRIVHVTVHPHANNGADVAPALITRVWSDRLVNVSVHLDGHNGTVAKTSVDLYADRQAADSAWAARVAENPHLADITPTLAFWPPKV